MTQRKRAADPVTGCAHIVTVNGYKAFRCCSECDAIVPEDIEEEKLNYCWCCGAMFDHADDEPVAEGKEGRGNG